MKSRSPQSPNPVPDGPTPQLTSAQFHILVTLAQGQSHGYGIMQEVEARTEGAVELPPGTLYRSLRQLMDRGLIQEMEDAEDTGPDSGKPRRSYALTSRGRIVAAGEARRLRNLLGWADEVLGLEGSNP